MIKIYIKFLPDNERSYKKLHDAAWDMLHHAVYSHSGLSFTEEDISRNGQGKPYFTEIPLHFGISHCSGCAVCGISDTPLGIDCETVRKINPRTAKKVFTEQELELISDSDEIFSRLWSLKESYVKFTGTGLAGHMNDIVFRTSGEYPAAEHIYPAKLSFRSIFLNDDILFSVCSQQNTEDIDLYIL